MNAFLEPDSSVLDYGAAKAKALNLTKSLTQEFGSKGIRVNAISPGPVSTDLWLGTGGVAQTVAQATGVDAETARKDVLVSIGARGQTLDSRRGRDAGLADGVTARPM